MVWKWKFFIKPLTPVSIITMYINCFLKCMHCITLMFKKILFILVSTKQLRINLLDMFINSATWPIIFFCKMTPLSTQSDDSRLSYSHDMASGFQTKSDKISQNFVLILLVSVEKLLNEWGNECSILSKWWQFCVTFTLWPNLPVQGNYSTVNHPIVTWEVSS